MSNRASIELLDRLEAALGGISDYRAAKELGVTQSAVSIWRSGRGHMSSETVLAACELAGLGPAAFYWTYRVSAERDTGRVQQAAIEVVEDIQAFRRGRKPRPDGLFALLSKKSKYAAAIVLALGVVTPAPSPATEAPAARVGVCILCPIGRLPGRGWRRRRRYFRDVIRALA